MQNTVSEPAREIPVRGEFDVIVAGAGLGGLAAALAAARTGAKTLLVERNSFAGGVATAGLCCSIFNCYFTGKGELGTTGIPVEVADALAAAEGYGQAWRRHKGHVIYDVERAKWVFDDMLDKAGVQVLYNAVTAGVVKQDGGVRGIVVETKSGREAVRARVVVDSTGDADVAALADAPLRSCRTGLHSLCFRLGNVDVDAFVGFFRKHPEQYPELMDVHWTLDEALAQYDDCGTFLFPHGGGMQMDAFRRAKADGVLPERIGTHDTTDACQMHAIRRLGVVHVITGFVHFDGLDADRITRSLVDGRRMVFTVADAYRKYVPGFEKAAVIEVAPNLGVRVSRHLDGDFVFTAAMMAAGTRQPDAVGRAVGWDSKTLHKGEKAWGCQVCRDDSFDLPYRCLVPKTIDGLLMGAGRSICTDNPWLLRVMVHTMVVGQAAGTAAAVAARSGVPPRAVDVQAVQAELRRQGVELG
ncbi:MAG: hypothetical protein A3K19_15810 [Lentisphaerae bacterium RIFOXYB12_FULL_65_16]|nr:MAG: hypothetical protein A3K18_03230 [Lentisphaerae bacterium RIFOXYA12_64_32]OGV87347.1 MAG: hypothetical protein A3K19_15810 [Lentisphaerae bacterium RIFOXYB12_FULL_65_16]